MSIRALERMVLIEGQTLRADVTADIEEITIDDAEERSDHLQITVSNHHGRWTDLGLFDEGNLVQAIIGYRGGPHLRFLGKLTAAGGSWPESGNPQLSVEAYDLGYEMGRDKGNRTWADMRDSDIAKRMAEQAGLQAVTEQSPIAHKQLHQKDMSDLALLFERAKALNWDVWIDERTLHFGPRTGTSSPVELRWGRNIKSIGSLRKSAAEVPESVTAKGWDPATKSGVTGKAEGKGGNKDLLSRYMPGSQKEAQVMAEARYERALEHYTEGDLEAEGDPSLRRGMIFRLSGLGKRFDGLYKITSSTHRHGSGGYITSISFRSKGERL